MIISATIRSGAFPLDADYGELCYGAEMLKSRYFKPFRGIVLREVLKRHGIKFDVFIDPCVESGCFVAKYMDIMAR